MWLNLLAQNEYSIRVAHGKASQSDLGEIIFGDFLKHTQEDFSVLALDGGYLLYQNSLSSWKIYAKSGFSYYNDKNIGLDKHTQESYEGTIYLKAYYSVFSNFLRFGVGEGFSYTSSILETERLEAVRNDGKNSKFLNYLDFSIDFNIGKIVPYKFFDECYIGMTLKHRSGIYGLINNVVHGGSNYPTLSIEKNF